jgi:hypothetical protein
VIVNRNTKRRLTIYLRKNLNERLSAPALTHGCFRVYPAAQNIGLIGAPDARLVRQSKI